MMPKLWGLIPPAAALAAVAAAAQPAITEMALFEDDQVVTASRHAQPISRAPATIYIVTDEDIARAGYRDLEEVLHDVPGFDFARGFGTNYSQIYQRGARSNNTNRTLLLVDGSEDNDLWSQIAWINPQYCLNDIKQIEIIHGPASALYGANAFLGVINIITKTGAEIDGARNTLAAGSYNTLSNDLALGKALGDLDVALSGRFFRSDRPDLSAFPDWADTAYQNAAHHGAYAAGSVYDNRSIEYSLYGRARYRGAEAGLLLWETRDGYGAWYRARYELTAGTFWHERNILANAAYLFRPLADLECKTKVQYRWSGIIGDSRSIYQGSLTYWATDNNSLLFEEQVNYSRSPDFRFTLGGQYEFRHVTDDYATDTISPYPTIPDSQRHRMDRAGVYFQAELGGVRDVTVTLGSRLDHHATYGNVFNPRLGIVFFPTREVYAKFLYGRAYQEPTAWERYSRIQTRAPNPRLKPERVQTFEFCLGHRRENVQSELNFFLNDCTDIIQTVTITDTIDVDGDGTIDAGKDQHRNLGRRIIYGLELRGKWQIRPNADVSADYSYVNPYDVTTNQRVGDISEHKVNLRGNILIARRLNCNLRANLVGQRQTVPTNPVRRIPAYGVAHLMLTYRGLLRGKLTPGLSVNNLTDEQYFDPGVRTATGDYYASALPQPRRNIMLSAEYRF